MGCKFRVTEFAAGLASAPSIHFGETGTGFYRSGANQVGLSINGVGLAVWSAALMTIHGGITATAIDSIPSVVLDIVDSTASHAGALQFKRARNAGLGVKDDTVDGDTLGNFTATGYKSGDYAAGLVAFEQDGASATGHVPGRIVFKTATASAGLSAALTLYADKGAKFTAGASFWGAAVPTTKPTITGARSDTTTGGALKHLLTALANYGLLTDSST